MARLKVAKKSSLKLLVRKPVVAGIFYPQTRSSLGQTLDEVLDRKAPKESFTALVVPHGGDLESHQVTGKLFSRLKPFKRALVLGPSHAGVGKPLALFPAGVWETPLGKLPVDPELAQALLKGVPDFEADPQAHEEEHAVEVLLPFLKRMGGIRSFVPLVLRCEESLERTGVEKARRLGSQIAEVLQNFKEQILLVISTNLSQYEPEAMVATKDQRAIERLVALDEEGLLQDAQEEKISMCGVFPAAVGVVAGKGLGASQGILIRHEINRRPDADGPASAIGYAGIAIR